jgi:ERCC4-type nuclease
MPIFGGTRGTEWTTSLNELKSEFERYLTKIKELNYDILNFKITKWHDDYGQVFKENVKSIENIYNTTILMTFKCVSTIQDAVEMLENFYVLAKRPTVIEFVQQKAAAEVYRIFDAEVKEVQELFDLNTHKGKRPPMPY